MLRQKNPTFEFFMKTNQEMYERMLTLTIWGRIWRNTRILLAPTTLHHVDIALIIFEMMEIATLSKATHSLTNNEARYEKMKKAAGPREGEPTPAVAACP